MFKSNNLEGKQQGTRTVVEKVVTKGGTQTKTTTITCTKDNFNSAFKTLDLDPEKFHAGGTSVTKQIIYTNSDGKREVLEETIETYGEPDKNEKEKNSKGKSIAERLGFGKQLSPKKEVTRSSLLENKKVLPAPITAEAFEKECLATHNDYRKKHGVPSLTLSKEMCAYAKEWADHLSDTNSFKHRSEKKYGENIFMKWSSDPSHQVTGKEAVDDWYSEIKDFTFGQEPRTLKAGHFTQVVWKESRKMGVAFAKNKSGKTIVVANYDPPGNFVGKFSQNVPPVKK